MADIRQSTVVRDDFNRVENPLSHGGDWSNPDTAWNPLQANGSVARITTGAYCNSYWNKDAMSGDDAECWAMTTGGNSPAHAWGLHLYTTSSVGGSGTSDGYFWRLEITTGGGTCFLYRLTNNAATTLDTETSNPPTGGGWIGLIRRVGTTIEGWASVDLGATWTMYVSATDGTYTGPMYAGLSCAGSLLGFDYFGEGVQINRPQIYRIIRGQITVGS